MITLERGGLLSRNPETERYRLGVDLIGLAAGVVQYMDVREVAFPILQQLAKACQETAILAAPDSVAWDQSYAVPLPQRVGVHV